MGQGGRGPEAGTEKQDVKNWGYGPETQGTLGVRGVLRQEMVGAGHEG